MTPSASKPLEHSQRVWRRAVELAAYSEQDAGYAGLLELLRAAHQDPTTISHALMLGRARLRERSTDMPAQSGVRLLEQAIRLGVKPQPGEVGRGLLPT